MRIATAVFFAAFGLMACSPDRPPAGRWEGTFESADTLIAARLEIEKDGTIYLTAPDAVDATASDADARAGIRQRLADGLATAWNNVAPRKMDFDGEVFRKPGGVAPQMIWNASAKRMTVVIYPGTRPALRIAMHAVGDFSADPWPQPQ